MLVKKSPNSQKSASGKFVAPDPGGLQIGCHPPPTGIFGQICSERGDCAQRLLLSDRGLSVLIPRKAEVDFLPHSRNAAHPGIDLGSSQLKSRAQAAHGRVLQREGATVHLGKITHDRQAKTGARRRFVGAHSPFKDDIAHLRDNTGSIIEMKEIMHGWWHWPAQGHPQAAIRQLPDRRLGGNNRHNR